MSIIRAENLTFCYEGSYDNVFENVGFTIDSDWKLGLVGRNGRGKTTLLNLLMGRYGYRGTITSSVKFEYFPYEVRDPSLNTEEVISGVCPNAPKWQVKRELSKLMVDEQVLYRPFDTLSNGERTKVLLAALFLNGGRFLLIDEPTNHLDTAARRVVSHYLNSKGGFILVSHDRSFLDGCVDHIMSINRSDIEIRAGNFSEWFSSFEERQQAELLQNERLKRDISRLKAAARRTSEWSDRTEKSKKGRAASGLKQDKGYVGHKAAKLMKRSRALEDRRQRAVDERSGLLRNIEQTDPLKLAPLRHRSENLAVFRGVSVSYDGRRAFGPLSFEIKRGSRIAVAGINGSGKTSVLKVAAGLKADYTGEVWRAADLTISYLPQDMSWLKGTLDSFLEQNGLDESLFCAILRKLYFERAWFERRLELMSPGQQRKVLIAKSLCESAHLYIWDEPLNYIDLYSRIQLEKLILEFSPTMVFVEHDEVFCNNIATDTLCL